MTNKGEGKKLTTCQYAGGEWITQYAIVDEMMQEMAIDTTPLITQFTNAHTRAVCIIRRYMSGVGVRVGFLIPYIPQLLLLVEPLFSAVYAAFVLYTCIAIYLMFLFFVLTLNFKNGKIYRRQNYPNSWILYKQPN